MMSTPRRAGRVQDKAICEYGENTYDQTDCRGVTTMLVITAEDSREGFRSDIPCCLSNSSELFSDGRVAVK